jgi:hypothetical protein
VIVGLLVDLGDLRLQQPEHPLDAAVGELGGVLHGLPLGQLHLHELSGPCHQRSQLQPLSFDDRGDVLGPILVARDHIGELNNHRLKPVG